MILELLSKRFGAKRLSRYFFETRLTSLSSSPQSFKEERENCTIQYQFWSIGKFVVLPADLHLLIQKNFEDVHECVEDSFMSLTCMQRDNVLEMKKENHGFL